MLNRNKYADLIGVAKVFACNLPSWCCMVNPHEGMCNNHKNVHIEVHKGHPDFSLPNTVCTARIAAGKTGNL